LVLKLEGSALLTGYKISQWELFCFQFNSVQSTSTKPTLVSHFNNIIPYTFRSPLACIQSVSSIEFCVSSSSGAYICPEFYPLTAIVLQVGSLLQV